MKKINVAIICGGPSNEREVSLKTGNQILKNLPSKYKPHLIEITKNGEWLLKSANQLEPEKALIIPQSQNRQIINKKILQNFDVVFIAMHGKFGEDGKIQTILELLNIPYTGSGPLASALGMNKLKTIELVRSYGIKTPKFLALFKKTRKIELKNIIKNINEKLSWPVVIKPNESGSSIGITIAKNEKEFKQGLNKAFLEDNIVLIEEYISGKEITCGVLGNSGKTNLLALPPVLIIPPSGKFFDYEAKYFSPKTQEICPAPINLKLTKKVRELSKKIHFILGCDGLTRSDFILSKNEFYFLEINTIPGLTEASLCPKEAKAAGISFKKFLDKQIQLALLKFKRK